MASDDETDDQTSAVDSVRVVITRARAGMARLLPGFIRRNYLLKFGLALLLVVAAISIVGVSAWAATTSTLDDQVSGQLQADADREAQSVSDWREERALWIRQLSRVYSGSGATDRPRVIADLRRDKTDFPDDVRNVLFIELESKEVLTDAETSERGTDLTETNATWARDNLSEKLDEDNTVLISSVYEKNGQNVIAFVTRIPKTSSDVAFVGVVDAQAFFTQVAAEEDRFTTVVNTASGDIAMANRIEDGTQIGDQMAGQSYGDSDAITEITGNSSARYLGTAPNQNQLDSEYVAATAPSETNKSWIVDDNTLVVVSHAREDAAFAVRDNIVQQLVVLIAVSLIGLALIGIVIGGGTVRSLERLTSKARALESGDLDIELTTRRTDEIGQLYHGFESMRDSLRERITEAEDALDEAKNARADAEAAREEAEFARKEAEQLAGHLEEKADEYSDVMQACAEGTLTERLDPESESEAMEEIAAAFNAMIDDIERTIATVTEFADDVSTSSNEVRDSSDEMKDTSESVSSSIQQITHFAEQQNERMQTVSNEMQQMSATVEEIASSADEVAQTSKRAAQLGEDGMEAAEDVVDEMEAIEQRADDTLDEIRQLNDAMAEIGDIVDVITDIAEQTNILALNANIEAAHSDQAGEGFAVVADEVKQLAEETKNSAQEIEELIENVQLQTTVTVEEMEDMRESVVSGAETVENSVSAFEGIADAVEEADTGVQEISHATDSLANSVQDVVSLTDQVAETSEETASEASSVASAAEEQTAAITEVTQNANNLYDRSLTLKDLLSEFSTDAETIDDEASVATARPDGADTPHSVGEKNTTDAVGSGDGTNATKQPIDESVEDEE